MIKSFDIYLLITRNDWSCIKCRGYGPPQVTYCSTSEYAYEYLRLSCPRCGWCEQMECADAKKGDK